MKILVTGSGGREHALAWKLSQSPQVEAVLAAPGNAGMQCAQCFPDVAAEDSAALARLCKSRGIDLVVVGPEAPLAKGVADELRTQGLAVFGPSAAAARLEGSKGFAREFMQRHGIPQPEFARFANADAAEKHVRELNSACVVKADGLAAGKGVAVCDGPQQALAALREIMGGEGRPGRFGAAGNEVLVEKRLHGTEVSYYAISDGESVLPLAAAQDYKRALEGDRGENTGGMGAVAPAPALNAEAEARVLREIVHPTIAGMRAEGNPFAGVLYVGLMLTEGAPKVVEFNVRFGDPETQALVMHMQGDLAPLLYDAACGRLSAAAAPPQNAGAAVCVVLASGGYPREFQKGARIHGLEAAQAADDVQVFFAGARKGEGGAFVTSGGRVLGCSARGETVAAARKRAYHAARQIRFDGMQMRGDIAATCDGKEVQP